MRTLQIVGRSSYVKVNDRAAFEAWLKTLDCEVELRTDTDPDAGELVAFVYSLAIEDPEEGYSAEELQTLAEGGEVEEIEPLTLVSAAEDWLEDFATHLVLEWVGVITEVGMLFVDGNLDAVNGVSFAVNAAGVDLVLDTNSLFAEETDEAGKVIGPSVVKTLGRFVTRPEG